MPARPENELDQEAQAALGRVKLDVLTAEPSVITPFTNSNSTVRWQVSLPDGFDDVKAVRGSGSRSAQHPAAHLFFRKPPTTDHAGPAEAARKADIFLSPLTGQVRQGALNCCNALHDDLYDTQQKPALVPAEAFLRTGYSAS